MSLVKASPDPSITESIFASPVPRQHTWTFLQKFTPHAIFFLIYPLISIEVASFLSISRFLIQFASINLQSTFSTLSLLLRYASVSAFHHIWSHLFFIIHLIAASRSPHYRSRFYIFRFSFSCYLWVLFKLSFGNCLYLLMFIIYGVFGINNLVAIRFSSVSFMHKFWLDSVECSVTIICFK